MKMKKFTSAALAALMCVSLISGCAKEDGGAAPNESGGADVSENAGTAANSVPLISDGAYLNPDWSYGQVAISGGGFITGVFATPEKDVYYTRTDVGGAYYRTPETGGKWVSMNYWVTADDRGLLGCDGLAFDPQAPNRVFLLLGTEYFSNGKTCIAFSDDYGKTMRVVDVTDKIKVHGNGMGRGNGERIAVDPNNGNIIFAGGRSGGMIKSTDGGCTWESVTSFPDSATTNGNGINCVLFDPAAVKDGVTQKIYASVSRTKQDNLFVSEDGGATWSPLPNSDTANMVQRMKLDSKGNLYVTYINHEGPWNCALGSIYRYGTDGTAENIAPSDESFGDRKSVV